MTGRRVRAAVLALVVCAALGCGKYGPPRRTPDGPPEPTPVIEGPVATAQEELEAAVERDELSEDSPEDTAGPAPTRDDDPNTEPPR